MRIGGGGNDPVFWKQYGLPMVAMLMARVFLLPALVIVAVILLTWAAFA